ncbi:MAG: hypothetical protein A3G24_01235 [Betaproteobacteria bacterium RIFCSPLOWO2_12_FULL_62_13]|nr:MAG: hypothetical protein A3G24_01235 [Betaproteobacteria bacterium RIFCSPLOWO2_12_FULL_62_13]
MPCPKQDAYQPAAPHPNRLQRAIPAICFFWIIPLPTTFACAARRVHRGSCRMLLVRNAQKAGARETAHAGRNHRKGRTDWCGSSRMLPAMPVSLQATHAKCDNSRHLPHNNNQKRR